MPPAAAARIPVATYRLQLGPDFDLEAARTLVGYLDRLGVTDLYCSPILRPRSGSTHGYDVVDPRQINPVLGGEDAFDALAATLESYGLGLLLDIVPNHMAASPENPWWHEVLAAGPDAPAARFFDIDWAAGPPPGPGRLLLPVLGAPYGQELEAGRIRLGLDPETGDLVLRYGDLALPVAPTTKASVREMGPSAGRPPLEDQLATINGDDWDAPAARDALDMIVRAQHYQLAHWPLAATALNYRRFFDIADLVALRVEDPEVFAATHARVLELVGTGAVTGLRIDHVDGLRDPLGYLQRLKDAWRTARRSAGAVDDAAADAPYIVVEKILAPDEQLPTEWPVCGTTGYAFLNALGALFLRPDGLAVLDRHDAVSTGRVPDFAALAERCKRRVLDELLAAEVDRLTDRLAVLAADHRYACDLPRAALRTALVTVTAALPVYRTYSRDGTMSDADRRCLARALERARTASDGSAAAEGSPSSSLDTRRAGPPPERALDFLAQVLHLAPPTYLDQPDTRAAWEDFVARWQQLTGPAAAKGVEDTALYVDARLLARNEVGGEPTVVAADIGPGATSAAALSSTAHRLASGHEADDPAGREAGPDDVAAEGYPPGDRDAFHRRNARRLAQWPYALLATATHDTKRGEDVRARLSVLSELAEAWTAAVKRWMALTRSWKRVVDGRRVPGPRTEQFLYQTLIGAWPLDDPEAVDFPARLRRYLIKAAREAKVHSGWLAPDEAHEAALLAFADALLDPARPFLDAFLPFQRRVAFYGACNGLSQVVLKVAAPGVPDIYRGTELWDLSLVDPDNRRPVDWRRRERALAELERRLTDDRGTMLQELLAAWPDGRVKLYTLWQALQLRRAQPDVFLEGAYLPVVASGPYADHVCAFARRHGDQWALAVVPRWPTDLVELGTWPRGEVWATTALRLPEEAPAEWHDVLGDATTVAEGPAADRLPLAAVLRRFPVALLRGARV